MSRQYETFGNGRSIPLDVRVAPCDSHFVLYPGDELEIAYEDDDSNPASGLSTTYTDEGLLIRLMFIAAPDIRLIPKPRSPIKRRPNVMSWIQEIVAAIFRR